MRDDHHLKVKQLFRRVAYLALSSPQQAELLRSWGVYPMVDELGLEHHESALMAPSLHEAGLIDDWERAQVAAIDEMRDQIPRGMWTTEDLESSEQWQAVREAALAFLNHGNTVV